MKLARLALVLAIMFGGNSFLQAQTAPNFENGWKPYGSYDGTHLDTVNLMNGNLMLHAPLLPDIAQRGALSSSETLYASSKDWQTVCVPNIQSATGMNCSWQKGGAGVYFQRSPGLKVHRTLNILGSGTGGVTFSAYGYSIVSADGATHRFMEWRERKMSMASPLSLMRSICPAFICK